MPHIPEDWKLRLLKDFPDDAPALLQSLSTQPPVSIRLHPIKGKNVFQQASSIPWCKEGRYLEERPVFALDPLWHAGAYYVQEASSMLIQHILTQLILPEKSINVLDACAAPGGKSTLLTAALSQHPQARIVCNEILDQRYRILEENLIRWSDERCILTKEPIENFVPLGPIFDLILVDAPCSGEGLFRKDPNAMEEWSLKQTHHCATTQKTILRSALSILREGGYLIYSTCTFNPMENQEICDWICSHEGMKMIEIQCEENWGWKKIETTAGQALQAMMPSVKGEGFFCAVFTKKQNFQANISSNERKNAKNHTLPWKELKENTLTTVWKDIVSLENHRIIEHAQDFYLMSAPVLHFTQMLGSSVRVRRAGLKLGRIKGKDLVPDSALAYSHLQKIQRIELNLDEALRFLRREPSGNENSPMGWYLASFQGLGLGYLKKHASGWTNHLPVDFRLRM